jgi:hypothetical protein
MSDAPQQTGGIGCFGVLTIVFVVLKLVGTISWSWWLVLLPFYGPFALVSMLVIFLFAVGERK